MDTIVHTNQHLVQQMLTNITFPHRQLPKALYNLHNEVYINVFWFCLHKKLLQKSIKHLQFQRPQQRLIYMQGNNYCRKWAMFSY